jgi:ATP-dependent protease ClpP protease subunit
MKSLIAALALMASTAFGLELKQENLVTLRGENNSDSVTRAMIEVAAVKGNDVVIFIDSPGGSVVDGAKFIDFLKASKKHTTCVVGFAASMAFVITQACDERVTTDTGVLMNHQAAYGLQGQTNRIDSFQRFIKALLLKMDTMQSKRIGISVNDFRSKIADDWWLFGFESKAANVVDKVTDVTCAAELFNKRVNVDVQVFVFTIKLIYSGCPILPAPLGVVLPERAPARDVKRAMDVNVNFRDLATQGRFKELQIAE